MKPRILLVDNVIEFLDVQARLLVKAGYDVLTASTIEDAEKLLTEELIHLAIIDQRMEDEDNEHDISGLLLARKEEFRKIKKLILTAYPDYVSAVAALVAIDGDASAIDYIPKQKGPEAVSDAVAQFFGKHFHINWNLVLEWKASDLFSVAATTEPGLRGESLQSHIRELEELFRRLFHRRDHVRVDRMLWQRAGRGAFVVYAFKEGFKPDAYVVVCGQSATVTDEALHFDEFAPKAPGETGTVLDQQMRAETLRFAANAYSLVGNDLESIETLGEQYRSSSDKAFRKAVTSLFQTTLQSWHQNKPVPEKQKSTAELFRQRLNLFGDQRLNVELEERVRAIGDQIATLGISINRTDAGLSFHFGKKPLDLPHPSSVFLLPPNPHETPLLINVPGTLTGENVLVDSSGRTWLTDFADSGLAPVLWNYVAVEAAIRFDWLETDKMLSRYDLEACLLRSDFAKPDTRGLEPAVARPARAIATIRKLSARSVGKDIHTYHLGIFFQAARRIMDVDPIIPLTSKELARFTHLLLSMAMIAAELQDDSVKESSVRPAGSDEIRLIDERARLVMVGPRQVRLAPQPFAVFKYLYMHADEVCRKEELLNEALDGEYDDSYLYTLIGRIRKVIEDDPETPRYLITEPSAGHRLLLKPKN